MDFRKVGDFTGGSNLNDISKTHSEILPHDFVHSDLSIFKLIVDEGHTDRLLALLALNHNGVALEDLKLRHLGLRDLDGRVIVVNGLLDDQLVWSFLRVQDSGGKVLLFLCGPR